MNKVWKATTITIMTSLLFITGCSPSDTERQTQKVNTVKQEEKGDVEVKEEGNTEGETLTDAQKIQTYIDEQNKKMEELKDEMEYYKQYAKDMILVLPTEKVNELINKEYEYAVTINNIQIPQSGVLEIKERAFDLVFTEERVKYSVLPESESVRGKINSSLNSSISTPISAQVQEEDTKTTLIYSYKELAPGDIVSLRISDDLKNKVSLNTNEIIIKVIK